MSFKIIRGVLTIILAVSLSFLHGQVDSLLIKNKQTKLDLQNNPKSYTEYLKNNLKYPETAKIDSVEGKVIISFQITKKGKVTKAKIKQGVRTDLDNEALRFVESMPDWEPARDEYGRPRKVNFVLPIVFSLSSDK